MTGLDFVYWILATSYSRSLFYKEKGLDFRGVIRKILNLSARKQTHLDDLFFLTFFDGIFQPACHETESKNTASSVFFACFHKLHY